MSYIEFPEIPTVTDIITTSYRGVLENCIRGVLTQYLGREVVIEDAKRVTIGQNPNWDYMLIAIDGRSVGIIKTEFGPTIRVVFTPNQ